MTCRAASTRPRPSRARTMRGRTWTSATAPREPARARAPAAAHYLLGLSSRQTSSVYYIDLLTHILSICGYQQFLSLSDDPDASSGRLAAGRPGHSQWLPPCPERCAVRGAAEGVSPLPPRRPGSGPSRVASLGAS